MGKDKDAVVQEFTAALTEFLVTSKIKSPSPEIRTRLAEARSKAEKLDVTSYDKAVFDAFRLAGLLP
jgi:hypothetical protein